MNYNSLNLKGTQKEIEEALADLDKTKEEKAMQTQPLFTLTAEEVELIAPFVDNRYQHYTNIACIYREDNDPREPFCREAAEVFLNLLNRIKAFQDENNNK